MFRGYDYNRIREDGTFMEMWVKKETLAKRLEKYSKAVKRINPLTKKAFVVGDTRKEDNKIFNMVCHNYIRYCRACQIDRR